MVISMRNPNPTRITSARNAPSTSRSSRKKTASYSYVVCIHTEPMYGTVPTDGEFGLFQELRAPTPQKIRPFIRRAKTLGLAFDIDLHGQVTDFVSQELGDALVAHFNEHNLAFSSISPHPSPSQSSTSELLRWTILVAGKKQTHARLDIYAGSIESLTQRELKKQTGRWASYSSSSARSDVLERERNVIFIIPTQDFIIGPLNGAGTHLCLSRHLWNHFHTALVVEGDSKSPPACYETCSSTTSNEHIDPELNSLIVSYFAPPAATLPIIPYAAPPVAPAATLPVVPPASPSLLPSANLATPQDQKVFNDWTTKVKADYLTDLDYDEELSIIAPAADEAAHTFFACLKSRIARTSLPTNIPSTIIVKKFELATLFGTRLRFSLGEGIGDGPATSTWAALLQLMVAKSSHWKQISENLYTPLLIPGLVPSPDDILAFKTYGLIIRLTLLHGHQILPVSPYLLLHLIHTFEDTINEDLMNKVTPEIAARLATWPPHTNNASAATLNLVHGQDPMNLVYDWIPQLDIMHIRSLSDTSFIAFKKQLAAGLLFGTIEWNSIRSNPLFLAMKSGFNDVLVESPSLLAPPSFIQSFGEVKQTLQILNSLYVGCVVVDPNQVVDLIRVSPVDHNGVEDYAAFETRALQCIARYLRGQGYPMGEGSEERQDARFSHPTSRARQFLKALTGSGPQILINFINTFSPAQIIATATGCHTHVCSQTMDFLINDGTKSLITPEYTNAAIGVSTPFDRWFATVIDTPADEYNNA
ncbi:hypothetical protein D9615_009387 [Tricholomella constricta]|uniref:Uncharacterized protein n=1 Tax=Tricholomella constricta TaxID=117010 RepID=A0A8H5H2R3_9AGAR|nr:hypothetical protein D9615_009387 [Tricholomella constricta]